MVLPGLHLTLSQTPNCDEADVIHYFSSRNAIAKIKDKAMDTENGQKYLNSLKEIHTKVQELKKQGLLDEWSVIMTGDLSMTNFLLKGSDMEKAQKGTIKFIQKLLEPIPRKMVSLEIAEMIAPGRGIYWKSYN